MGSHVERKMCQNSNVCAALPFCWYWPIPYSMHLGMTVSLDVYTLHIYIYTHRSVCTYIYIYMSDMSYIMYILHTYNYAYLYGIHWYTVPKSISCNQVWFFCSLDSQQIQARSAGHGLQIPSRTQCTMLRSGLSWFDKYEALSTSLASTWLNGFFGKLYKSNPSTSQNTNKMDVRRVCHSFYSRSPSKGVH